MHIHMKNIPAKFHPIHFETTQPKLYLKMFVPTRRTRTRWV